MLTVLPPRYPIVKKYCHMLPLEDENNRDPAPEDHVLPTDRPIASSTRSPSDFPGIVALAYREKHHLERRIDREFAAGRFAQVRHLEGIYLSSRAVKLCAVVSENLKTRGEFRLALGLGRETPSGTDPARIMANRRRVLDMVERMNLYVPSTEIIRVVGVMKSSGDGFRAIQKMRLENKARQRMVRDVLVRYLATKIDPRQHHHKGRGPRTLIAAFRRKVEEGFVYFAEIDGKDCFPSLDPRLGATDGYHFERLPLPPQVIENVVTTSEEANLQPREDRVGYTGSFNNQSRRLLQRARIGLPTGAAVSGLVQSWSFAEVLRDHPDTDRVCTLNYADNFYVLGRSKADVAAACLSLQAAARSRSGGRLSLPIKQATKHVRFKMEVQGYEIAYVRKEWKIEPKQVKQDEFRKDFIRRTTAYAMSHSREDWNKLRSLVVGFRAHHPDADMDAMLLREIWWLLICHGRFGSKTKEMADRIMVRRQRAQAPPEPVPLIAVEKLSRPVWPTHEERQKQADKETERHKHNLIALRAKMRRAAMRRRVRVLQPEEKPIRRPQSTYLDFPRGLMFPKRLPVHIR